MLTAYENDSQSYEIVVIQKKNFQTHNFTFPHKRCKMWKIAGKEIQDFILLGRRIKGYRNDQE